MNSRVLKHPLIVLLLILFSILGASWLIDSIGHALFGWRASWLSFSFGFLIWKGIPRFLFLGLPFYFLAKWRHWGYWMTWLAFGAFAGASEAIIYAFRDSAIDEILIWMALRDATICSLFSILFWYFCVRNKVQFSPLMQPTARKGPAAD